MPERALILVDLQNDFMPGGPLAVPDGDQVIAPANAVQKHFGVIAATQDWHPRHHGSFASNHEGHDPGEVIDLNGLDQVLWPDHCVQDTPGADFVDGLDMERVWKVFRKGTDPETDSYSGFYDNGHRNSTGLAPWLRERGVEQVYVLGVATDYCVKFTALDAVGEDFETFLIADACRGVNLKDGDADRAIEAMKQAGVKVISSEEFEST